MGSLSRPSIPRLLAGVLAGLIAPMGLAQVDDELLEEIARKDDRNYHMVAVEALVVEVNEERTRDLGIKYGFNQLARGTVRTPNANGLGFSERKVVTEGSGVLDGGDVRLGRPLNPVRVPVLLKQLDGITKVGFDEGRQPGFGVSLVGMNVGSDAISARLRALLESGDASIRTRPIALALHNTLTKIEAADEVPFLDLDERRNMLVRWEKVGVKMEVQPTIVTMRPGIVTLDMRNLEVSSVSSFITQQNVERPVFNESSTSTRITMNEGETCVIGGLKTRRTTHREERVPILGSIPLLGLLFRSQEDLERNMDVFFFIKSHILAPGENVLLPFDFKNQRVLRPNLTASE